MTEGLAIEIAKQKMAELEQENYLFRLRHFQLAPLTQFELKAFNELLILIQPDDQLKVYSKTGIYNKQDKGINEMQYLHTGVTTLYNQSPEYLHIKLLQVIPKTN